MGDTSLQPTSQALGRPVLTAFVLSGSGCSGVQSALQPDGAHAQEIADLFWGMTIGGSVIFVAFVALALYATYARREPHSDALARRLIVFGAVVFPTVVLAALLMFGLSMLPRHLAAAPEGSLRIKVSGEQWWWRVRYELADGTAFDTANEVRLPVGQPVQFELSSPDVIHSFWIPNLAGKMDMIPGRTTHLALTASRPGVYRGACAEYCGTSHAWMAFSVEVLEPRAFVAWAAVQAAPAVARGADVERGRAAFLENGCGACHTVRGTVERSAFGPDLTHVGGRHTVGAGRFARSARTLTDWIAHPDKLKPGVHMPSFAMLSAATLRDIATYLESLK